MNASHLHTTSTDEPTPWGRMAIIAVGVSVVVGVILLAFAWPAVTASPQDLPVGIVGTAEQVSEIGDAVHEQAEGAIALTQYEDRDAAVEAIEMREAYGAIVLGAEPTDAPEVLKATAANPQVAQLMDGLAQQLQARIDEQIRAGVEANIAEMQQSIGEQTKAAIQAAVQAAIQALQSGQPPQQPAPDQSAPPQPVQIPVVTVTVTDVVPLADSDPRGAGLVAASFPLTLGGMLGGIALTLLIKGGLRRAVGVVVYAAAAGLVLAGILQAVFGALQGSYVINASAMALAIAAISGTITGLAGLLGPVGAGIGALFMLLIANPISAATVPVQFILSPWGAIGQWLPPGAAATLIRDLSYFPQADASFSWLVLATWAVVGIVLTAVDIPGRRLAAGETAAEHPLTV